MFVIPSEARNLQFAEKGQIADPADDKLSPHLAADRIESWNQTHRSSRRNRAQRAVAVDVLNVDPVIAAAIILPGYSRESGPNNVGR